MDTQLMLRYIREILIPAIGEGCILMNEFAAHKTDVAILEMIENNINPIFIPGGHTDVWTHRLAFLWVVRWHRQFLKL